MKEILTIDKVYSYGDNGPIVKAIQEWLLLHGYDTRTDGVYGESTEEDVYAFQADHFDDPSGNVDPKTFEKLVRPMIDVINWTPSSTDFKKSILELATLFEKMGAKEYGANMGPWVRLVMNGEEGTYWHWCMGYVTWIIKKVSELLNKEYPLLSTFSCTQQAEWAKENGKFIPASDSIYFDIEPGDVFLIQSKNSSVKWVHTGFVLKVDEPVNGQFLTIEGNYSGKVYSRPIPNSRVPMERIDWIRI